MNTRNKPILFVLSGLPATGKSTLAKSITQKHNAFYLRIDTIEQGIKDLCNIDVQGEGYGLAYKIAGDNLELGLNVVADSCNPIDITRKEWEKTALLNDCDIINIEILCSNKSEHKKRAESRAAEIENLKLPDWSKIINREYHKWEQERIVIDTAHKSIKDSASELNRKIEQYLNQKSNS